MSILIFIISYSLIIYWWSRIQTIWPLRGGLRPILDQEITKKRKISSYLISYFSVGSGPNNIGHFMVNYVQSWSQKKEIRGTNKLASFWFLSVLVGRQWLSFSLIRPTRRFALTLRTGQLNFFFHFILTGSVSFTNSFDSEPENERKRNL